MTDATLADACGPCLTFQRPRARVSQEWPPEAPTGGQVSPPGTLTTYSKSFSQLIDFGYQSPRLAFPWPFARSYRGVRQSSTLPPDDVDFDDAAYGCFESGCSLSGSRDCCSRWS